MSFRKLLTVVAVGSALAVAAPALPGNAAPSGGCPYPPNRPVLTLSASPATVIAGKNTVAFGKFTQNSCGISGASVALQRRALVSGKPSGSWSTFKTVTTNSNGVYSATRYPLRNEQIRAVFNKAGSFPTTVSSTVNVWVRTFIGIGQTTPAGCKVHLSGSTKPVKGNRTVKIQKRGPAGKFKGWTTVWSTTTNSKGAYFTTRTLACNTTYNLSVYIAGDSTNVSGRSRTLFGIKTHH